MQGRPGAGTGRRACLCERDEVNVPRWEGTVAEGRRDSIEVMGADGDEGAPTADVVVQPILQVEERVVRPVVELAVAQHGTDDVRPDLRRRRLYRHRVRPLSRWLEQRVLGPSTVAHEDVKGTCHALEAQDVVPVGWHLDLVDDLLAGHLTTAGLGDLDGLRDDLIELDAEFEAQVLEFVLGERPPERGKQRVTSNANSRHASVGLRARASITPVRVGVLPAVLRARLLQDLFTRSRSTRRVRYSTIMAV